MALDAEGRSMSTVIMVRKKPEPERRDLQAFALAWLANDQSLGKQPANRTGRNRFRAPGYSLTVTVNSQ
jgi:hypothetical protein